MMSSSSRIRALMGLMGALLVGNLYPATSLSRQEFAAFVETVKEKSSNVNATHVWGDLWCNQNNFTSYAKCQTTIENLRAKQKADWKVMKRFSEYARLTANETRQQVLNQMAQPRPNYFPVRDPNFAPKSHWNTTKVPELNIIGIGKAGTSHAYKLLSSHPDVSPFFPRKEKCITGWPVIQQLPEKMWYDFFDERHRRLGKTLYACILAESLTDYGQLIEYMGGVSPIAKYFLLLRDPAEHLWASFNFWAKAGLDNHVVKGGQWANAKLDYRSPEIFHEIVMSDGKATSVYHNNAQMMVWIAATAVSLFGREHLMVIRSEDMAPELASKPGGFLDRLANFTGLDREKFPKRIVKEITNCNENKGANAKCQQESVSGAYAISGYRQMLPETRLALYLKATNYCKAMSEFFGVEYPECINAVENFEKLQEAN